ncbi:MAG: hypothetical protein Hyperionvirus4_105 [Hyperionvirus sp.]|uniref:Uncharacterized protein n=1 Tax=Hyperionvirus sp. TaxID=2487770 RepID=A0A3G5A7A3_9VIRU|nr:MAG: hypothetical protein Hyperionvirus4_105 [Hyperionvirus sp.]
MSRDRIWQGVSISLIAVFLGLCFGIKNLYLNEPYVIVGTFVISLANLLSFPQLIRFYYGKQMTYDDLVSGDHEEKNKVETVMAKKFLWIQSLFLAFYLAGIAAYIIINVSMPQSLQEFTIEFASVWTTFALGFRVIGRFTMWFCQWKYSAKHDLSGGQSIPLNVI